MVNGMICLARFLYSVSVIVIMSSRPLNIRDQSTNEETSLTQGSPNSDSTNMSLPDKIAATITNLTPSLTVLVLDLPTSLPRHKH